jgi:hypothetical protein
MISQNKSNKMLAVFLVVLTILSIGLVGWSDNIALRFLPASLKILGYIRVPSLTECFLIYFLIAKRKSNKTIVNETNYRQVIIIGLLWLMPTGFLVLSHRVWVPHIVSPIDIIAFMITGLMAEEFM